MRCLSCQEEMRSTDAKLVLSIALCPGCAAMAEKGIKELELETARALVLAKNTFQQHILKGGLMRTSIGEIEPIIAHCPKCNLQHIDKGEWATKAHKTHRCEACGAEWRPKETATVGVDRL